MQLSSGGMDFGYLLGRIEQQGIANAHANRATQAQVDEMRAELETWKDWARRIVILVALWGAASSTLVGSDQASTLLAQVLEKWLG